MTGGGGGGEERMDGSGNMSWVGMSVKCFLVVAYKSEQMVQCVFVRCSNLKETREKESEQMREKSETATNRHIAEHSPELSETEDNNNKNNKYEQNRKVTTHSGSVQSSFFLCFARPHLVAQQQQQQHKRRTQTRAYERTFAVHIYTHNA